MGVEGFSGVMAESVGASMYPDDPAMAPSSRRSWPPPPRPAEFLAPIANIAPQDGVPNVGQANFLFNVVSGGDAALWEDATFRAEMGTGWPPCSPWETRRWRRSRVSALRAAGQPRHGRDPRRRLAREREQIMVAVLNTPDMTAALLEEHHGNLGTALTEAQYTGFAEGMTADLLDGTPRLGPDGLPILSDQPLPPLRTSTWRITRTSPRCPQR